MSLCSGQDSMAQDDIPLKPHQLANYKFPSEHLKKKKAVYHAFQSDWFSSWQWYPYMDQQGTQNTS